MAEQRKDGSINDVLGQVAYQMKETMTSMYAALQRIAPAPARDADGELDDNAAILTRNFYRLRRLAANLEEAADLDAPSLPLRSTDDIVGLCRTVTERAVQSAEMLGLQLTFRSERASHIIAMDAERVERLVLNLLSNAFKFTKPGGRVVLEVCITPRYVEIRVTDTGCGISEEHLSELFDRYRRMGFPVGTEQGLGLGLPISRKIAADHGGSLVVLSQEGKGTTVVATLENKKTAVVGLNTYIAGDYSGGFNRTLLELSDALPREAFKARMID